MMGIYTYKKNSKKTIYENEIMTKYFWDLIMP
jgi:hypothetical protein